MTVSNISATATSKQSPTGVRSSWGLSRKYRFTDYDGLRPDWGKHTIDWSVVPPPLVEAFRNGTDLELKWLTMLAVRTRRFQKKIPVSG